MPKRSLIVTEGKARRRISTSSNTCPTCGKTYKHKHHLKRHRDFECGVEPKFNCVYCPHKTRYKDSLMKHVLARHERVWKQQGQQFFEAPASDFEPAIQMQLGNFEDYLEN